jgi:hypothetical protein
MDGWTRVNLNGPQWGQNKNKNKLPKIFDVFVPFVFFFQPIFTYPK